MNAVRADANLFAVLGAQAMLDERSAPTTLPTWPWSAAGCGASALPRTRRLPGRTMTLNGEVFTVLGVMPERFQFPYRAASLLPGAFSEGRTDLWVPLPPRRSTLKAKSVAGG